MIKLDHLSIPVSDWKASRDWWVRGFGFAVEFEVPEGGRMGLGVVALQDDGGLAVFLEQHPPPIQSGQASYTLQVEDVHAVCRRLSEAGVPSLSPPGPRFWGYGAEVSDPDGHRLLLWDAASMAAGG